MAPRYYRSLWCFLFLKHSHLSDQWIETIWGQISSWSLKHHFPGIEHHKVGFCKVAHCQHIVDENTSGSGALCWLSPCVLCHRCLQNYIPAHSLTLSCPVCRQTSILPEKGVAALQNNFFITNLMDVLQRTPGSNGEDPSILQTVTAVAAGKPLSCPNHDGNVS